MGVLVVWGVSILIVVALVGGRQVVIDHPQIVTNVLKIVNRFRQRRRRVRKVTPFRYVAASRLHVKHHRWFAVNRTTSGDRTTRTAPEIDITEKGAYQPLNDLDKLIVEHLFTLNQHLPANEQWSCRKLYPHFGGTRQPRMAELSEIKQRVEKQIQEQQVAERRSEQEQRLATIPIKRPTRQAVPTT